MSLDIIKAPVVTEKTISLANKNNVYTFLVERTANKTQIKEAITKLYKVEVIAINTIMNQADFKRTGRKRVTVRLAKEKKALITLKKGDTIDLFDIGGNE